MVFRRSALRHVLLAAAAAVAAPAVGQTASAQPETAASTPLADGEIIVTAQRRAERLRDVPLAVSAYSGATLDAQQITTATDLRLVSPSLNFTPSANARGEGFAIRGVGTSIFSDTVEQSVGVVLDGVVLGRSGQATSDLVDVERVEVLRGPQGLLFGKNASAGVISITTRRPQLGKTTLDLAGSYATYDELKTSAVVNLPLGQTLAFRAAYSRQTADGIIYNRLRDEDVNDRNEQIARAKLLFAPNDAFDVLLTGDWQRRRSLCCAWTARSAPPTTPFGALSAAAGIVPSVGNREIAAGARFFQDVDAYGFTGEVNYDLGFATLTSITAYRDWENRDNNDPDLLPINVLDINTGNSNLRQLSQEVRLASPAGGTFEYVVGLFYYDQKNRTVGNQTGTLGQPVPAGVVFGSILDTTTENESKAAFGQVTIRPFERLKLIGGARYTDETVDLDFTQRTTPGALPFPGRFVGTFKGQAKAEDVSWRATAQYDLSDRAMVYATVAEGFKGPGINTLGVTTSVTEVIQPEIPTTYEIGSRASFLDNSVNLNVALFKTTYKNFQAQIFDQNVTPGRFRVTNAGELDTKGLEVELALRPTDGLSVSVNGAYIDAEFADFRNISCYTGQPILPFGTPRTSPRQCIRVGPGAAAAAVTEGTGNRLTNTPEFNITTSGRYEWAIGGLTAFVQANYQLRSDVSFSAAGDPNLVQDGFGIMNGSVGVGSEDGRWTLTLFGKNLFDTFYATNLISQPVLNAPGVYSQFFVPEARRIVGVAATIKFGD